MSNGGRGKQVAFSPTDYMQWTTWKKEAGSAVAQEKVSLTIDNHLRTTFFDDAGYLQNVPKPFRICAVEEKVGGVVKFGADCSGMIPNPAIAIESFPKDSLVVKTKHLQDTLFDKVNNGVRLPGVKILGKGGSTSTCETAPMHGPLFAISESDGSIYMFDRRVRTAENTLAHPDAKRPASMRYECPNVPKNFLNAHTCRTGAESCAPVGYSSKMFTLDEAIVKKFYTLASRHVHVITGLTTENSPCTTGTSRWVSRNKTGKCDDRLDADSRAVIIEALQFKNLCKTCDEYRPDKKREGVESDIITRISSRSNGFVRDVLIHKQCKAEAGAQVLVDGTCWQHVHENEMNVYDFTYWANAHDDPKAAASLTEGSKAVAAFAETGSAEFKWTGSMPLWDATTRDRRMKIGLLGPFGNNVDFVAIPLDSRVEEIARVVGSEKSGGDAATEVCGSPGEVASDPYLGDTVNMALESGETGKWEIGHSVFDTKVPQDREGTMVFQNIMLGAQDQLRQRVAWALNQLFVVNDDPVYR
jgi:cullin-associated NEDD8-dissociated protein 1